MTTSIYARAMRGELPSELLLSDVAALATASAFHPDGSGDLNQYQVEQALMTLIRAQQLDAKPENYMHITPPLIFTAGARPIETPSTRYWVSASSLGSVLSQLGLVSEALRHWCGATSPQAKKAKPSRAASDCPEATKRAIVFAYALMQQGAAHQSGSMPFCHKGAFAEALMLIGECSVDGLATETLAKYIGLALPRIAWKPGRPPLGSEAISAQLVAFYHLGKEITQGELETPALQLVASRK